MAILVDTSAVLRLRDPADPRHADCSAVLKPSVINRHRLCVCAQTLMEYWVVVTRPAARNGFGLSAAEAADDINRLRGWLPCLPEPSDVADRWFHLVTAYGVSGKPAHDARFVAVMAAHGIDRFLTLNPADFARYPHVTCVTPAQLLAPPSP